MVIQYTYTIINVDQQARCMEIVYEAEGQPVQHVGARLPYEGETVEAVVQMYAPVRYWEELNAPVAPVTPGQTGSIVVPPPYVPTAAEQAVVRRNALLAESDWTQLADVPLSAEQKAAWVAYRQQLRDVPSQTGFPDNISWPTKPGIQVTVV